MDTRFIRVWEQLNDRKERGVPFNQVLGETSLPDLVMALAGAARSDAVAANAIATHILNRIRRAMRQFVAAIGVTILVMVLLLVDGFLTGAWGVLETATLDLALAIAATIGVLLLVATGIRQLHLRVPRR